MARLYRLRTPRTERVSSLKGRYTGAIQQSCPFFSLVFRRECLDSIWHNKKNAKTCYRENPVKRGDAQVLLDPLGLTIDPAEEEDFHTLLAAVHECAAGVAALPDYQPVPDQIKYPRENVRRPSEKEQVFGQAWAHRFLIRGNPLGGPLAGKSVSLKDVIAVASVPQLLGSDIIPSWTPTTDATVVTRLLEAGADIHGTSTCENLCHSTSSYTSAQGTVDNPHAKGYSSGGSTSGGAALVAAGLVDITIGGDQGGSIRVPASFCGCEIPACAVCTFN